MGVLCLFLFPKCLTNTFSAMELKKIKSIRTSANFGAVVNGRVNRVLALTWSPNDSEFEFVGQGQEFSGNMILPDNYTETQIEAFRQKVQSAVDEGRLHVYGYEYPVSVVSNGTCKAYKNPAKPESTAMETIRRAWPEPNASNELLNIVRQQTQKAVDKGKLIPVTA